MLKESGEKLMIPKNELIWIFVNYNLFNSFLNFVLGIFILFQLADWLIVALNICWTINAKLVLINGFF